MQEVDPGWVGIAGVITAVGTFIAGQKHGKAEFLTAVTKASEIVIKRLERECIRVEEACRRSELREEECRVRVAALEEQIGHLMRGNVVGYKISDLKRVGD